MISVGPVGTLGGSDDSIAAGGSDNMEASCDVTAVRGDDDTVVGNEIPSVTFFD